MDQRFCAFQRAADGFWLAVEYASHEVTYWPWQVRTALCDSQAHAQAVATGWADEQQIAVLSEAQLADLLLEDLA